MKNAEKYIDPSRLALPERPPNKVNQKMKAPKPTRKNKQPRHEVEKPARPHSSEETATQDEEDKQNKKTDLSKTPKKQKHPK